MRGDLALSARLAMRGGGLAGSVSAIGGLVAIVAARSPWFHAMAEVAMLGTRQQRAVASLTGVPDTVWGWSTLALGLVAVVLGVLVALDRPPLVARRVLLGCGLGLVATAVAAWLGPAPALDGIAGAEGGQLAQLARRLPMGVALELHVRAGIGPPLSALAGVLVVGGTLAAREL
ncbi:hypothetical protein [Egicoccus sp. AB-alg6-2]|uniref:hypothetical protein n=1 Tax=Egicoccus sp. AB-alg6-2 TaxID=3242692 RepID=UPI00359E7B17